MMTGVRSNHRVESHAPRAMRSPVRLTRTRHQGRWAKAAVQVIELPQAENDP